jgi:4-carboxymuconolactone decarboxylase
MSNPCAVHESLAARMRPLGAGILGHGLLEPRVRELMILRTCARCGAPSTSGASTPRSSPRRWDSRRPRSRQRSPAMQILELVIAGGWYHTISFVINAAGVQLEPWAARFPAAAQVCR